MKNKKIINKMFENKFEINKINEEILLKIETKNRIKKYSSYSIVSACLIIIVCGILYLNNERSILNNNEYDTNIDDNKIYVNKMTEKKSLDIDGKAIDLSTNGTSLEYGLVDINLPEGVTISRSFAIYTRDLENNSLEYNILHDYVYIYNNSDNSKEIDIAFSKVGLPLRCYRYNENGKESIINGNKLVIYGTDKSYNVIFKYKDYNFDVETRNITLEELIALLESIII